jgi:hypothetical protein
MIFGGKDILVRPLYLLQPCSQVPTAPFIRTWVLAVSHGHSKRFVNPMAPPIIDAPTLGESDYDSPQSLRLKSLERERFMAIFYAYFDESGKQGDHPLIALSAVCASQLGVQRFENDWRALLRQYGLQDFHMVKAVRFSRKWGNIPKQTIQERIEAIKPFADCITDNLELGVIQAWDVKGFRAIPREVLLKIGNPDNPYYTAFVRATLEIADHVQPEDVLSLVCDHDEETALNSYLHYMGVRKASEKVRKKTASISFSDDKYFPVLQGADLVAFLTRLEAREQFYKIPYNFRPLFEYVAKARVGKIRWFKMFADETKASNILKSSVKKK